MDTNKHEDRWTSLNDKRHQNASAILCPWCDFVPLVDNPLNWFQTSPAPALLGRSFKEETADCF